MAEVRADVPQLNDPQLEADLLRVLSIRGPLGKINIVDAILPVVLMGTVRPFDFQVLQPSFDVAAVFAGATTNPGISAVIVDTGQLPAGTYDVKINVSYATAGSVLGFLQLQLQRGAIPATVASWNIPVGATETHTFESSFAFDLFELDAFRVQNITGVALTGKFEASVMARIRT